MYVQSDDLPPGWETRKSNEGWIYYVDHGSKTTHTVRMQAVSIVITVIYYLYNRPNQQQQRIIIHAVDSKQYVVYIYNIIKIDSPVIPVC